jgi:hypothetical protein
MFGGTGGGAPPSDTWTFDGTTWTQLSGPGPSARLFPAMATLNGKVVLFGGQELATGHLLQETWTFDGTTRVNLNISGPPARTAHAMTTLNGRVFVFGGQTPSSHHPPVFSRTPGRSTVRAGRR